MGGTTSKDLNNAKVVEETKGGFHLLEIYLSTAGASLFFSFVLLVFCLFIFYMCRRWRRHPQIRPNTPPYDYPLRTITIDRHPSAPRNVSTSALGLL
jgi:hypothetical protein